MKSKQENRWVDGGKAFLSWAWWVLAAAILLTFGRMDAAEAAPTANIAATRHNLSKNAPTGNTVKASSETQVCVFCHTPHAANASAPSPLWNRSKSTSTYTRYTSSSLDANAIVDGFNEQPAGSSVLCLSCHDGTIALGNVNVLNGLTNQSITLTGTGTGGTMPGGAYGELSGYTRRLGTDLSNDHPISITYNDDLAFTDGEMARLTTAIPKQRDVNTNGTIIGVRTSGYKPLLPLEPTGPNGTGQVQCATCHDPHLTAEKFLRLNRRQVNTPIGGAFSESRDIICLACHDKLGTPWAESAHAKPIVADESYDATAATVRDFPTTTTPKVWEAACLNCHDTHTVSGSRRLLREGVNSTLGGTGTGSYQQGSSTRPLESISAIENTCYQCHASTNKAIGIMSGSSVPDIMSEFSRSYRMPIKTADQAGSTKKETHDITNADFIESQANLGLGDNTKRHVECTDCHNPHRVRRGSKFYETSSDTGEGAKRTHNVGGVEGNVASGVLRGTWGVEPNFGATSATWPQNPTSYDVKKGDPGANTSTARSQPYLTREYQLCFKCHSSYSNGVLATSYPSLGNNLGGTTTGTNGMTRYTNVAGEFGSVKATDPPSTGTDQGESSNVGTACGGGDCVPSASPPGGTNNHRSWHPVMWPTGRDRAERGSGSWNNLRAPYALADVGKMTMHCSDCHGSSQSWLQGASLSATSATSGPDLTKTQGPHGSDYPFLLKGKWDATVTPSNVSGSNTSASICGRCHDPRNAVSGFAGSSEASHGWEVKASRYCMFCHVAVPHGWKNKAFLVNLNCVQEEGGSGYTSTCTSHSGSSEMTIEPYYYRARLRISSWARSGNWQQSNCNGEDWMSSACGQ